MKKPVFMLLAVCFGLSASAQSWQKHFDSGWKFIERDVKEVPGVSFNDASWADVDLPHDWDIYHAPYREAPMGNDGGRYPVGTGEPFDFVLQIQIMSIFAAKQAS